MSYAAVLPIQNFLNSERPLSEPGVQLTESWKSVTASFEQSISLGWKTDLKTELISLFDECSEPGWDGYDAESLSKLAKFSAMAFIDSIPEGAMTPEVSASPDDGLTFEWEGDGRILSVTIYDDIVVYAQLIGGAKQHGEVDFLKEMPDAISSTLLQFFSK